MNTKLFKKNIKFFKKEKPEIYEFIKEKSKVFFNLKDTDTYTYLESPKGKYIEDKQRLFQKITNNIDLVLIKTEPEKVEESQFKRDWIHDTIMEKWDEILKKNFSLSQIREKIISSKHIPLLFLNGLGAGNVLNILKKEDIKVDNLLIYEPDFYKFLSSLYLVNWENYYQQLNGNIFFIIGENIEDLKKGLIIYFTEKSPTFSLFFISINLNEEKEEKIQEAIIDAIRLSLKGWGYYDDEVEALIHVNENLKRKYPYIARPLEVCENSNLFIIGSGPSLDERIDFIKANKDKAVIFSCGTALHKLYKEGIIPDFQIELERADIRVDLFSDLPEEFRKKISILAADVVPYRTLELYNKPVLFSRTYSISQYLLNPILYVEGISPTVVNTATALSLVLGFKNIYFFGVDMGYKNPDKKHASGTIYDSKLKERQEKNYIKIKDNYGNDIYTDDILFWAKNNLEYLIKGSKERNFYNLSLGAKIEGTKFIENPSDISFTDFDKKQYIDKIFSVTTNNYKLIFNIDKRNHYQTAKDTVNILMQKLNDLFSTKDIKERFKKFYEIHTLLKDLSETNMVAYTLLSGTIKHVLSNVIYLMYSKNINKDELAEAINSMNLINENLDEIKEYFTIKI